MLYGTIMGSMESATEWIGAKLTTGVGKAFFKSGAVEGLKALGLDIAENFFEEAIMEPIQETVKQAIGKDGDWQGIGKRMLQSGINGALTSIIMGGASAGIGKASNLVFKMQSGEQVTQKEIADTLKEINKSEEVDIEKILANNFKFTAEDLAVNLDAQQRTEQRLDEVAETLTRNEAQQLLINNSDLDDTQKEVLSEIATQYNLSDEDVKKAIQNTKDGVYQDTTTQNNEVLGQEQQTIQDENKMAQNETSQEQRDLIQDLQKFNETRQEGQEIFDLDNEENVKEVQTIQKLAQNRNINISFDESRFKNNDTNAFYEYDEKGNVANIVLNPNSTSKKYIQNLVVHELTHSFEGSKQYNALSKAILDYAKSTGEYDTAFKDLMETYSKVYSGENLNKIVEKEAVANMLGEKLGDREFINSLVNNQYVERSTIQKFIDFIKNQINRFKGYKDQEAYWNHVKTLWEEAYNESGISKEGLKNSVEQHKLTDIKDSQGRQLSKGQVEYFKDSKVRDENGNLITVFHGTPNGEFTVFDKNKIGSITDTAVENGDFGNGFYFTPVREGAESYATGENGKVVEAYVNLKNPLRLDLVSKIDSEITKYMKENGKNVLSMTDEEFQQIYDKFGMTEEQYEQASELLDDLNNNDYISTDIQSLGYDGVISPGMEQIVAFEPNQIKNIDNLNPTENDDIRYSIEGDGKDYFYRGQEKEGNDLSYNSTGFIGLKDGGYYFTPNKETANKYGNNIIERYRNEENTVTVKESDELQKMATEKLNEHMKQGIWTEEDDLLEQMSLGRSKAFAEYTGKPFVETGDKFGEDAEAIYYPEFDKESNIKETAPTKDSQGRTLSKQQQEYFKDSKILDRNGLLLTVYHGTPNEFNVFEMNNLSKNTKNAGFFGDGFYFSPDSNSARQYGKNVKEGYLNITNPYSYRELSKYNGEDYYTDYVTVMNLVELNKEWGNIPVSFNSKETWGDIYKDVKSMLENGKTDAEIDNAMYDKYGELGELINDRLYTYAKRNNYKSLREVLIEKGYDGIINAETPENSSEFVAFNSNQFKNENNTNPTNNPDIRFSKDTTGSWNSFIEKYFKNEGTGTAIKDLKKLPTREYTIQDFEEVINNSANIPEADKKAIMKDLEGIELTKDSLNAFKDEMELLDNNYKDYAQKQEQQRFDSKNYKDEGRAELISKKRKEFSKNTNYNDSVVAELDEIIPRNRNGKRTVAQWKDFAKQIGQRIANMSPEQIEDIAVKSYYDLEPTKAITKYDNQSKTNLGYEQLYANDWVNEVYEGVRENRQYSIETENNEEIKLPPKKEEIKLPPKQTSLEEDIEAFRQETRKVTDKTKGRKHLETYATSESVGKEGRKVARELYKTEQYVPISNRETMTKANTKIQTGGADNTYIELTNRFKTNEKMTLQDIATGERLIQIYSAQGDYAKVNELMQDVAILGTELGQQVQALSIIKKASPEGQLQLLNRLVERTNNKQNTDIQITDEQAEKILKSKNKEELDNNVSEVTLELAQQLPITMKDKIRSWRYLSMLGNPRTHIRNIVGNVAMNVLQNTKNKVAGAGEDIASIFNKNLERTKTLKRATREQRDYAKADAFLMEEVLENGGKYSAETLFDRSKRQFDNKFLNKIADINSNLLEKEDTIFLKTAYKQALQGYMSANKITAQEMENNPKVANKARQYAIEQAQEATFHQFNALASTLNQVEERGGIGGALTSAILPFKKTPLNIAKTGIEYSPLNIMRSIGGTISDITQTNKELQNQLNKGKITQQEYNSEISNIVNNRIDQMAKGLTGTALGLIGYALSKMGVLKATNKDDEDEFEESLGKQEFSIQIGDNTYSLDWLAPTAIPLFIGANVQELFNETGEELNEDGEQKSFYDRLGDTLNTTVTGLTQAFEPMTEMSMLQGLASALSSYEQDSSNKIFDIMASAGQSYAGQFIPTALGQVAKTIDPVVRDTSSTKKGMAKKLDQFKRQTTAKLPFLSTTLPAKSDVWGEDKTRADNLIQRFVETAVLPYNREKLIDDMTSETLKEVFNETGESGVLPKNPQKYFTINKQKYNLTSDEYNNAKKIYGKTSKDLIDSIIKTEEYKELDKDTKVKLLKDIYSYSKEEIKVDYSNKKDIDLEAKVDNSKNKYNVFNEYKSDRDISKLLKLYNKK